MPGVFHTVSQKMLQTFAKKVRDQVAAGGIKKRGARIIILSGNLGSGKTTFVQKFAKTLGVHEKVLSPTFVFLHEHVIPEIRNKKQDARNKTSPFTKLIHIDAYRIDSKRDFASLGIRGYLQDKNNLILIEWGEKIVTWIPRVDMKIEFRHHTPALRRVRIATNKNGKEKE